MEEDIRIVEEMIKLNRKRIEPRIIQAIENLINKNKEQEEQIEEYKQDVKEAMHEAQENAKIYRKEQAKANEYKKMIELMGEYILKEYISPEICSKHTPEDCYADIYDDNACRDCILEHFRKKAKGE